MRYDRIYLIKDNDIKELNGYSLQIRRCNLSAKSKKIISVIFLIYIVGGIVIALGIITYFFVTPLSKKTFKTRSDHKYIKHYVLITQDSQSSLWETIYESAKEEAKKYNAYVEYMGKNLATQYSVGELLRIAIDCKVDGIMIDSNEGNEVETLINEAVQKEITVITILNDCPTSIRQCFIGMNNYSVGKMYSEQILDLANIDKNKVLVLMDRNSSTSNQGIIYSSIKENISKDIEKGSQINLEVVAVNNENIFSTEEAVRDIIVKDIPDIIVCLNEVATKCAYQAAVDHNKVGQMAILGYYDSPEILAAVKKEIIYATVAIDAKQVGEFCIEALKGYEEEGRISDYLTLTTNLITVNNVDEFMDSEK